MAGLRCAHHWRLELMFDIAIRTAMVLVAQEGGVMYDVGFRPLIFCGGFLDFSDFSSNYVVSFLQLLQATALANAHLLEKAQQEGYRSEGSKLSS